VNIRGYQDDRAGPLLERLQLQIARDRPRISQFLLNFPELSQTAEVRRAADRKHYQGPAAGGEAKRIQRHPVAGPGNNLEVISQLVPVGESAVRARRVAEKRNG
jgi:hypothetical protein